ncbi:hypothetical protein LTR27_005666 [Elasticomyces elasticus]|nr:hypothetical protein LTR27_005666 [Elasticomyces elasticus]
MRSFIIFGAAAIVAVVSADVTGVSVQLLATSTENTPAYNSATESASIATTTATTSVPAPAETTPASVESSASATAPSGEPTTPDSEPPAPSTPAGSETATAPPSSLATATGTPTPLSSSRSSVNKGCGFLLCRDVYFNGGEWCLSVVPVHERISGTRNPEKARREQEREERREQESKGPLTEQQRKAFGDYITCSIELGSSNAKLKEYGARYSGGAVETFIAIAEAGVPFVIHIESKRYIALHLPAAAPSTHPPGTTSAAEAATTTPAPTMHAYTTRCMPRDMETSALMVRTNITVRNDTWIRRGRCEQHRPSCAEYYSPTTAAVPAFDYSTGKVKNHDLFAGVKTLDFSPDNDFLPDKDNHQDAFPDVTPFDFAPG